MPTVIANNWNVVVTTYDREFNRAMRLLSRFGRTAPTAYRNLFVMHVDDIPGLLRAVERELRTDASIANSVARISPVSSRFNFHSPEEFEAAAGRAVEQWLGRLEGKTFHVRVHRRGFKGRLSSQQEEQRLGRHLLQLLERQGASAAVTFDNADLTIVVEILDGCAGAAIWTREDLEAFQMLRLD